MERNKYAKALSMNLMISFDVKEIARVKEIIRIHELNNKLLRDRIKSGCRNGYEKQKFVNKIHRNSIIIRGMQQYIVELRSEMKEIQKRHPLNQESKNDLQD